MHSWTVFQVWQEELFMPCVLFQFNFPDQGILNISALTPSIKKTFIINWIKMKHACVYLPLIISCSINSFFILQVSLLFTVVYKPLPETYLLDVWSEPAKCIRAWYSNKNCAHDEITVIIQYSIFVPWHDYFSSYVLKPFMVFPAKWVCSRHTHHGFCNLAPYFLSVMYFSLKAYESRQTNCCQHVR
jgi:hypothetical protein